MAALKSRFYKTFALELHPISSVFSPLEEEREHCDENFEKWTSFVGSPSYFGCCCKCSSDSS
jgi:hypothetical protein